ncbi:sialic acid TRAP transporter substrate-binding protein SiaP [Salimicrobium jeotgali]|uniref:sialic acid TRAP transporter substrate-binding protein SiaP n=1 Tax=Salimicrobium jeotgali TaxID=1230341 RepID=UPI000C83ECA4|nr:sialic acid TRAP transporter substrate-binding protein SiaP [Salimicrobium jeotgali]
MLKRLFMLSAILLLAGFLAACSGDGGGESEASSDGGSGDGETKELKFGMVAGTAQNEYKAAETLKKHVEEESGGDLSVKLYPDSQLGDDRAMLEQVREDSLDITLAETGRFGIWVPRAELMGLPYIVDDFDHLKKAVYETEYGKGIHEELKSEHNWKVAGTAYNGTRQTTSSSAIESLEDMEGMKLRVPEADTLLDYAEYTGAAPTPMAFTEVYMALQTGSVDGQENPLSTIDAQKFYEVQDYLAMTNHVVNDANYVVSQNTWESLSEENQKILQEGIDKAVEEHTKLFKEEEKNLISKFEEEGMTVTEPDLKPFREAVSEVYPEYLEDIEGDGESYLQQIKEAK